MHNLKFNADCGSVNLGTTSTYFKTEHICEGLSEFQGPGKKLKQHYRISGIKLFRAYTIFYFRKLFLLKR